MTSFATSSTGGLDDASLARAAAAGDRTAFAEIYDRYADRLHDFCVGMLRDREAAADCVQDVFVTAATKLVQLREPDRLRSWLYAIARSEALARIRARKREQLSEELPEMPSGEADMATLAARTELADLIKEASGGLSDRDQVVLELAYRQGLDGPELADALGVTAKNANTLVERLRETIARSLGALLLCRRTKADPDRCPELAAILDQWDGQFTVLMRKRVARHIDGCAVCEDDRARMVSPAALLGASPMVIPAPAWLRGRTLDRAMPKLPGSRSTTPSHPGGGESWWPPSDFDGAGPFGSATTGKVRSRARWVRAAAGAALVLLGIGGAAVLAAPHAFHVAPADSREPLTSSTTSTTSTTTTSVTTTPSIVERTAPSEAPAPVPAGPVTTTTTVAVIAPTTETTTENTINPEPPPVTTREPEPSTVRPTTTHPTLTITRPEPSSEEPNPPSNVQSSASPAPPTTQPSTIKPKPTFSVPKKPPTQEGPVCPQQDPQCNSGGGGPIIG
jgi:RNA polymerase sigma factor (sigma-70 family)